MNNKENNTIYNKLFSPFTLFIKSPLIIIIIYFSIIIFYFVFITYLSDITLCDSENLDELKTKLTSYYS